jgi:hypothetical protein
MENARLLALVGLLLACMAAQPVPAWEHWGGDAGGTLFSSIAQITPANVNNLVRAWELRRIENGLVEPTGWNSPGETSFMPTSIFTSPLSPKPVQG